MLDRIYVSQRDVGNAIGKGSHVIGRHLQRQTRLANAARPKESHQPAVGIGQEIGDRIKQRLVEEVAELGILGEVRGKGCLVGVEFVEDMNTKRPFSTERRFGKRVERRLLEAGLILRCDPNWIAFAPPLITTPEEADEMVDIFVKCLGDEVKEGDLL